MRQVPGEVPPEGRAEGQREATLVLKDRSGHIKSVRELSVREGPALTRQRGPVGPAVAGVGGVVECWVAFAV